MSDRIKYTPEQIVAEAQRVARVKFVNGSFDIGEGHLCDMLGELRGKTNVDLFLSTFGAELIRISNENREQRVRGEDSYLQGNT